MAAAEGTTESLREPQRDAVLAASRGGEPQGLPQFMALALSGMFVRLCNAL